MGKKRSDWCVVGKSVLGGIVLGASVYLCIEFFLWVIGRLV